MTSIYLAVFVAAATAIKSGVARSGETAVALSEEALRALSEAERAALAEALSHDGDREVPGVGKVTVHKLRRRGGAGPLEMPSADLSPTAVVAAIRVRLGELAADAQKEAAELAQLVAAADAESVDDAIDDAAIRAGRDAEVRWGSARGALLRHPKGREHPIARATEAEARRRRDALAAASEAALLATDPAELVTHDATVPLGDWRRWQTPRVGDLVARGRFPGLRETEATRAHLARVAEVVRARDEADRAELARRKAAAEAREAEQRAAVLAHAEALASESPAWAGAALVAREGYDAMEAAADAWTGEVMAALKARDLTGRVYVEGTAAFNAWEWEARKAPRPSAVATRVAVREALATVPRPASGVAVEAPEVGRVTWSASDDREERRETKVVVLIDVVGAGQRAVLVDTE